jgi:ABC-2 type transport system permease protein
METLNGQNIAGNADQIYGDNSFAHSSPGMMLQFAIAGLIGAAEIMVLERRSRCLQRLMTTPISRSGILLGHFLAMFVMIILQLLILSGFGDLALGLTYWQMPLATGLMLVSTAFFVASMGLLIGVLAKSPEQSVIYSLIPMFVLAGLGGAWVPLEFTGKAFQTLGHLSPLAWAMDGLKNILIRGLGIQAVLTPLAVLLGYAVVLFALATWQFYRRQEN